MVTHIMRYIIFTLFTIWVLQHLTYYGSHLCTNVHIVDTFMYHTIAPSIFWF
jgi:hypothetical protein